jgi:ABC-type branched-subunit amino acid transport system ATPase component
MVDEMNGLASSVPAVRVEGVVKHFGETVALDGAGLEVPVGMVFGLLGPNGAGKTTLVRILATLLAPDAGRAEVLGHDVEREPAAVRELLGLTGQFAAVDELLTGRENLENQSRHGHRRRRPLVRALWHPGVAGGSSGMDRRPAGRVHTAVRMALPADELSRVPLPEDPHHVTHGESRSIYRHQCCLNASYPYGSAHAGMTP